MVYRTTQLSFNSPRGLSGLGPNNKRMAVTGEVAAIFLLDIKIKVRCPIKSGMTEGGGMTKSQIIS